MNFPFYIASRYLIAKKTHNAINIITFISALGVMVGTMALVVVLSVFNGFDDLIHKMFSTFDPELKITAAKGKVFDPDNEKIKEVYTFPGIDIVAETLEENTLVKYEDKQFPAIVKGVSDNYAQVTGIDSMVVQGEFKLKENTLSYAIIGQGLAYYLSYRPEFVEPLNIYYIKKDASLTINLSNAIKNLKIFASGVFMIEQTYDSQYMILPIDRVRKLLDYDNEVSALEIKVSQGTNIKKTQIALEELIGDEFIIKNRFQQNEAFYKIMQTEKWAIFFILIFILIIASFNIVGSLVMLVLDKKNDIATIQSMGATQKLVNKVFIVEGWLISLSGVVIGILLGTLVCWLQMNFGIVKLSGSGSFIIDHYPVLLKFRDIALIFLTVNLIGFLAALIPVKIIGKKLNN